MDALFFFRHSAQGDQELRYALRGVAVHMPWVRKVWIFGDKPVFLSRDRGIVEHVAHDYVARVGDYRTPMTNFFLMLYASSLIPGMSSEYLWFCDDFICIDDVTPDDARRTRCVEDMSQVANRGTGLWQDSLWKTYDLLQRLGYPGYNFETHTPTFFTRKRVFEAWCDFQDFVTEDRWFGLLGPTAVLNHATLHEDLDVVDRNDEGRWVGYYGKPPTFREVVEGCRGRTFLNFDDDAFGPGVANFLQQTLPLPCRFERV